MPHPLLKKQNDLELIMMLKASSAAYKEAKSKEYWYTYFYMGLAALYVFVYIFLKNEQVKHILFAVSFFLTVTLWWFSDLFKGNTLNGALFKEMFDTALFGISWKFMLHKPGNSDLRSYALKYGDKDILDWYPDNISENLSNEQATVVCQYTGSYWDIELRKKYLNAILTIFISFIIIVIAILFWMQPTGETIFLLAFSLLSFFSHFITLIKGNLITIKKRKAIVDKLDEMIKTRRPYNFGQIRDIQDAIFNLRLEPSKVHPFFYKKYNTAIRKECDKYITEVNKKYDNLGM